MSHYARDPSHRENLDVARLAQLFHSWPDSNEYHISECNGKILILHYYKSVLFYLND